MKNIYLIGFMATGKTSVGRALARRLHRELVDVDTWVEANQGRTIREIFERNGEAHFRALERDAIKAIAELQRRVVTTGGGVVLNEDNMETLRRSGIVVALHSRPETILKRVGNAEQRPLLAGKADKLGEIRRLLNEREGLYERCDLRCETDGATPARVAAWIEGQLKQKGLL